ncbi:MAG: methylenetetrahydrofolate--tRNA-(uracil(54)-C(5))-methyltransferase (FADH(2)-oxidizing) TrmFO [Clostridia bacterium]
MNKRIVVIGGGLAGSEAAWQMAKRGAKVTIYEMRGNKSTPAHKTDKLAELVCSNSFRGNNLANAPGVLKEELRRMGSLIMEAADYASVPAGGALAVDRDIFSTYITAKIVAEPAITLVREEVTTLPQADAIIIATGPLTSDAFAASIAELTKTEYLNFYDAAAPIITRESIDFDKVFFGVRYQKGDEEDYLNCPLTEKEYNDFYEYLLAAKRSEIHLAEDFKVFEGCMPIEDMAQRGKRTLLFGPLKPVGLRDPRTDKRPYAVIQLRKENKAATLFNLVGFQTSLIWSEQKKLVQMIPGLEQAEIVRYGVMHRNTFINSPSLIYPNTQLKHQPEIFFAGQITGIEGYIESAASGWLAGYNVIRWLRSEPLLTMPAETMLGALQLHITDTTSKDFQPIKSNFGIMPELDKTIKDKKLKKMAYATRALAALAKVEFID